MFAGSLREIHVSILGTPDDYAVEVASGAWFGSVLFPVPVGLLVGGPIGLAAGAAFSGIMAYEYEKHMWKKILEIVRRESKVSPTVVLLTTITQVLDKPTYKSKSIPV